jgi:hypothetical protein
MLENGTWFRKLQIIKRAGGFPPALLQAGVVKWSF